MRVLYIILLIAWLILGYFMCKKYLCGDTATTTADKAAAVAVATTDSKVYDCVSSLSFIDIESDFNVVSDENFQFASSNADFNELSVELETNLDDVVDYLSDDAARKIQIKGCYTADEANNSEYDNLGLARADNVKAYFIGLGVSPDQIIKTSRLVQNDCISDGVLSQGVAVAIGVPNN